ncbi:hypothetical protein BUALT_Bualt09G0067300 [Buddleja alternifolia]|uniref:phosphatidate phosphatase n=1 Tax=Buddleja alternifolia TaxID=168488 RepID=A0AAV6X8L6_9LAMI|nr:hypothetical protein BUALT_Bualt09G0067300 [Buddleja alternifolia]
MNVVGRFSSFMTSVATPFHPFGGAVDIIVVKQQDGTYRSTPWYVRFGKFQGVLKGAEKVVQIEVNGVEANFNMYLDNSGEAYFVREVDPGKDDSEELKDSDIVEGRKDDNSTNYSDFDSSLNENDFYGPEVNDFNGSEVEVRDERFTLGMDRLERVESDGHIFYEFQDEQEGSLEFLEYGSGRYDILDSAEHALESQNSNSEVILVSVDGNILTAPKSSAERNGENVQLSPSGGTEERNGGEASVDKVNTENLCEANSETMSSEHRLQPCEGDAERLYVQETHDSSTKDEERSIESNSESTSSTLKRDEVFQSCLALSELALQSTNASSIEILEANEEPQSQSRKPLTNDGNDEGCHEILRNDDTVSLPDLQVEAATHERNTLNMDHDGLDSVPVQVVSNDEESQKQIDVDLAVRKMQSDEEIPTSEDEHSKSEHVEAPIEDMKSELEISLCGDLLYAGMGLSAAEDAFEANRISPEEFKLFSTSMAKNENLIVRLHGKYLPLDKAGDILHGMADGGLDLPINPHDEIPVEQETPQEKEGGSGTNSTPLSRWGLWPIQFRRGNSANEEVFVDSVSVPQRQPVVTNLTARPAIDSPRKQIIRTNVLTTDQIASLNLKEGQNTVNFVFSTRVLGSQKVEAHIYLWRWNTRIVISDVDGTITKSDVLGQFMPLVGKDWTHTGIARLLSAIKENGYQLLYLSARAIVQAYLTKSFLFNLKQDGKSIPSGPVVISPDGLFPSLYREVIRRAPHEFKIACLEDIKALFPSDYNPFYAGFGNRDTDELSYRKIGIPKGKIFIINPKGEVVINHRIDVKSYTSLHTLVNNMFSPTSMVEQEDYNSWNYWKVPLPDVDDL